MTATPTTPQAQVVIDRIGTETIRVPIIGTAPLIVHRFSEKAKQQMLDNMRGVKRPKQAKDPEAEYEAAFYRLDDGGYGVPVIAFKAATVGGARFYRAAKMTELRQSLFIRGEYSKQAGQHLARITGEPHMREDVVRVSMGGTDLRYRPEFPDWRTELEVTYVQSMLTRDSVLSLIEAGGMGVGIGEWRVEKRGDSGTYEIDQTREVEVLT
jgi:hypothetical protein